MLGHVLLGIESWTTDASLGILVVNLGCTRTTLLLPRDTLIPFVECISSIVRGSLCLYLSLDIGTVGAQVTVTARHLPVCKRQLGSRGIPWHALCLGEFQQSFSTFARPTGIAQTRIRIPIGCRIIRNVQGDTFAEELVDHPFGVLAVLRDVRSYLGIGGGIVFVAVRISEVLQIVALHRHGSVTGFVGPVSENTGCRLCIKPHRS